jgi:hypothetical protein
VQFAFYRLRFEFLAKDPLDFAPGMAANTLRGALGIIFRRIACVPQCPGAKTCEIRETCPYARTFEPSALRPNRPSGLSDWPRPFVFRARHLDAQTIQPGDSFYFDLHVFTPDPDLLHYFTQTFAALATEGLGPHRAKAELQRVYTEPMQLDLTPPATAPTRIRIDFLSPTELKHDGELATRPEFPILFARIRDRISTLSRLYGTGPLDIDYQGTNDRASKVKMISCDLRQDNTQRRSSRTGQCHLIGGFLGTAEYEGDLAEFLPFLQAAKWTGVGRQPVWGKGEIEVGIGPFEPTECHNDAFPPAQ